MGEDAVGRGESVGDGDGGVGGAGEVAVGDGEDLVSAVEGGACEEVEPCGFAFAGGGGEDACDEGGVFGSWDGSGEGGPCGEAPEGEGCRVHVHLVREGGDDWGAGEAAEVGWGDDGVADGGGEGAQSDNACGGEESADEGDDEEFEDGAADADGVWGGRGEEAVVAEGAFRVELGFAETAGEEVAGFFESGGAAADSGECDLLIRDGVESDFELSAEGGEAFDFFFEGFLGGAEGEDVEVEAISDGVAGGLEGGGGVGWGIGAAFLFEGGDASLLFDDEWEFCGVLGEEFGETAASFVELLGGGVLFGEFCFGSGDAVVDGIEFDF